MKEITLHPDVKHFLEKNMREGKNLLETPYNGKTPNATKEKWGMASKILSQIPDYDLLRGLLGDEIAREFKRFLLERNERKNTENEKDRTYRPIRKSNVKKFVVDVSKFRERDLVGYWDYDESYFDDEMYWEPDWFRDLKIACRDNPYQKYVVVFTGTEKASDVVYGKLKGLQETGKLCKEIKLPRNARYGKVKLLPRIQRRDEYRRNSVRDDETEYTNPFDYSDYDVLR